MSQLLARTAAHAAYHAALADPAATNWREIAETLFSALPALPKAARDSTFPTWWADYELPRTYLTDSLDVLFADGEAIRVNIHRAQRGLPRIPAACRVAIGFYRERHGRGHAVPAFASLTMVGTRATFDASACSAFTAELRAIPGTVARRAVTLESLTRMRAELARREAGHAAAEATWNAAPKYVRENENHEDSKMLAAWRSAVEGGKRELLDMEDAYAVQRGERPAYRARPSAPLDAEEAIGHLADWHDAEPEAFEIAGTVDADTGPDFVRTAPVTAAPVDHVEPEATIISGPTIEAANLSVEPAPADAWCPDERSHPVVALALSHKAREELWARVLDGTFADGVRTAKCGAWRVTLQDALDLQDIASIRWVGLPRKPHAQKAVAEHPAADDAQTVAVEQSIAPAAYEIPAAAFYPGALRPDCALTLHGPSM